MRLGLVSITSTDFQSSDRGYAVRDIVREICDLMGYDFEAFTVAVGERLGQDATYVIDSTRAREEFAWAPKISLKEGLAGVISWVEENWEQIQKQPLEYIHKA